MTAGFPPHLQVWQFVTATFLPIDVGGQHVIRASSVQAYPTLNSAARLQSQAKPAWQSEKVGQA